MRSGFTMTRQLNSVQRFAQASMRRSLISEARRGGMPQRVEDEAAHGFLLIPFCLFPEGAETASVLLFKA